MSTPRRAVLAGALLALALVASGCAGDARPYPPTGVDGLTVPLPVTDPADFVATVDNPWFPLVPGTRWTYRSTSGPSTTTAVAEPGPVIAGVRTTALRSAGSTDYYAQDRAGNVWWFGHRGEWQVRAGVGAGLAMPAHPRRGDGFVMASAGDVQVRGVLVDTDRTWESSLARTSRAVVLMEVRGSVADVMTFVPGIGLVANGETGLVKVTSPVS
jgi:hypothetical protein